MPVLKSAVMTAVISHFAAHCAQVAASEYSKSCGQWLALMRQADRKCESVLHCNAGVHVTSRNPAAILAAAARQEAAESAKACQKRLRRERDAAAKLELVTSAQASAQGMHSIQKGIQLWPAMLACCCDHQSSAFGQTCLTRWLVADANASLHETG